MQAGSTRGLGLVHVEAVIAVLSSFVRVGRDIEEAKKKLCCAFALATCPEKTLQCPIYTMHSRLGGVCCLKPYLTEIQAGA